MKHKSCSALILGLLLLSPLAGWAETIAFPEVGKTYYLNYANPDENPAVSKVMLDGLSHGSVTILQNSGNGWAEVEFVRAVFDMEKQTYVAKKVRTWVNFARVTSATELVKK